MVGNGINSAPALAQTDIGIVIGTKPTLPKKQAHNAHKTDLRDVALSIEMSKRTM